MKHYKLFVRYCDAKGRELARHWPAWEGPAGSHTEALSEAREGLLGAMPEGTDTVAVVYDADGEQSSGVEYADELREGFRGVKEINSESDATPEEVEEYQKELLKSSGGILKDDGVEGLREVEVTEGTVGKPGVCQPTQTSSSMPGLGTLYSRPFMTNTLEPCYPFQNVMEMSDSINDPRYGTDQLYRRHVESRIERTDDIVFALYYSMR